MTVSPEPQVWPKGNLHDWESLRPELLFIYDRPLVPGSYVAKGDRGGEFSAWLVRAGSATLKSEGETACAQPGQWLVCFGRKIEQSFHPSTHLLSLRVQQGWPDGSRLFRDKVLYVIEADTYPRLESLADPLLRIAKNLVLESQEKDPRVEFLWKTHLDYRDYLRYRSFLSRWLEEFARVLIVEGATMHVPGGLDPRLERVFQILDATPPGRAFPKGDLCRAAGLTLGHLNRLCVRSQGFSVAGYWEKRRVQRACQALEIPGMRIKEVASLLGFVQLSHFSAWFKRFVGVSPRAYRASLGAAE